MSDNKGNTTYCSNKIGLFDNQDQSFVIHQGDVVINFPFKDTVLVGGMSKEDKATRLNTSLYPHP